MLNSLTNALVPPTSLGLDALRVGVPTPMVLTITSVYPPRFKLPNEGVERELRRTHWKLLKPTSWLVFEAGKSYHVLCVQGTGNNREAVSILWEVEGDAREESRLSAMMTLGKEPQYLDWVLERLTPPGPSREEILAELRRNAEEQVLLLRALAELNRGS